MPIYISTAVLEFQLYHLLTNIRMVKPFFLLSIGISLWVLFFWMTNKVEHIFECLLVTYPSSFMRSLLKSFAHFPSGLFFLFLIHLLDLTYSGFKSTSSYQCYKYLLPCGCFAHLIGSFHVV